MHFPIYLVCPLFTQGPSFLLSGGFPVPFITVFFWCCFSMEAHSSSSPSQSYLPNSTSSTLLIVVLPEAFAEQLSLGGGGQKEKPRERFSIWILMRRHKLRRDPDPFLHFYSKGTPASWVSRRPENISGVPGGPQTPLQLKHDGH